MKKIIDDYSPILEDVPFEEIKDKVKVNKNQIKRIQLQTKIRSLL